MKICMQLNLSAEYTSGAKTLKLAKIWPPTSPMTPASIGWLKPRTDKSGKICPLRPQDTLESHRVSRRFWETELAKGNDGETNEPNPSPDTLHTIIITHHAPHRLGLHPNFKKDTISVAYASDLTTIIETHQPDLWVFGYTHTAGDFKIGKTRLT